MKVHVGTDLRLEHMFQVMKRVFDYRKVKYRGLAKNGAHVTRMVAAHCFAL